MTFFTVVFLAAAFLAAVLVTVVFLEGDFFAGVFFAGVFFLEAAGFLAAVFLAGDFFLAAGSCRQESPQSISAWVVSHDAGKRGGTLVTEEESRYQLGKRPAREPNATCPPEDAGAHSIHIWQIWGNCAAITGGQVVPCCASSFEKMPLRQVVSDDFFSGESSRPPLHAPLWQVQ